MKICPTCGMGLDDGDEFCPACGTPQTVAAPAPEPVPPTAPVDAVEPIPATAPVSSMDPIPATTPVGPVDTIPATTPVGPVDTIPATAPVGPMDTIPATAPVGPMGPIPATAPVGPVNAAGPAAFCPNCGERLEPDSVFCPNCGASLEQPGPAPKKGKAKKAPGKSGKPGNRNKAVGIIAVAVPAVIVVVLLAVFVFPLIFMSDADRFLKYQAELFLDPVVDVASTGLDAIADRKLNTDLTITAETDDADINEVLEDSSVVLKLDLDGSDLLMNGALNLMGTELFTGSFAMDDKTVSFYLPQADDTWYSMELAEFYYRATGMELDEVKAPDIDGKQVTKVVNRYLGLLADVINEDSLEVEKDERVTYQALDGRFTGTLYTFEPSRRDIQDMIENIADQLEDDKDLLEILTEIASYSGERNPEKEARNVLKDAAEALRDNAKEAGKAVEEAGFVWTLAVEDKTVRQILITANGWTLGYESKGNEDDRDHVLFSGYAAEIDEEDILLEANTSVDGKKREGTVTVPTYSESYEFSYEIDNIKETSPLGIPFGSYELLYSCYDYWDGTTNSMTIALDVEDDGDGGADHVITLNGSELFDDEFSRLEITVNASKKGSASKPKADTEDITDYSNRELQELLEDLSDDLAEGIRDEIGDDLMEILGGGSAEPDYGW